MKEVGGLINQDFLFSPSVGYLEEVQESWFRGARLPHHSHRSAEVVDVLTIGVQHHGF